MIIALSWPDKTLNPNVRAHWAVKNRTKRSMAAIWAYQLSDYRIHLRGKSSFKVRFQPPDNRRRDVDNIISSLKYMQDTLATFCGCDDSKLKMHWPSSFDEPHDMGRVILEIME